MLPAIRYTVTFPPRSASHIMLVATYPIILIVTVLTLANPVPQDSIFSGITEISPNDDLFSRLVEHSPQNDLFSKIDPTPYPLEDTSLSMPIT